mgnify:CR=1 FL=1
MTEMSAEQFLVRLFESDTSAADYYTRNPPYAGDSLLGAKPWWPPLSEVWAQGEHCPYPERRTAAALHWPEAWALLQELYQQYRSARGHA